MHMDSYVGIDGEKLLSTPEELGKVAREQLILPFDPHSVQVLVTPYTAPGLTMYVLVNQQADEDYQRIEHNYARAVPVSIAASVADAHAVYYDLLEGAALDNTNGTVKVTVPPGGSILLAYPEPIGAVHLTHPASTVRGNELALCVEVLMKSTKRSSGMHLLELDITTPHGQSAEYSRMLVATDGRAEVKIPLAVNDPPGTWHITVREVASSLKTEASVLVQ